jgi:hypothetical protein
VTLEDVIFAAKAMDVFMGTRPGKTKVIAALKRFFNPEDVRSGWVSHVVMLKHYVVKVGCKSHIKLNADAFGLLGKELFGEILYSGRNVIVQERGEDVPCKSNGFKLLSRKLHSLGFWDITLKNVKLFNGAYKVIDVKNKQ